MNDSVVHDDIVLVFSLGGTIAMAAGGDRGTSVVPALSGPDLIAAVPGLADVPISVKTRDYLKKPGASLTLDDLLGLHEAINDGLASACGAVVIQGTDTLEETAYFLDLLHDLDAPVVLTGAMRNPAQAGADGPANLLASILVAADPMARGLGALVVMSDEIHAARYVRKRHSMSTGAFTSPDSGPLGYIVEGRPRILVRPPRLPTPSLPESRATARVAVVPMVLGDQGELLSLIEDSLDGLVVAAFGVGHVPSIVVNLLEDLARRIPVVLASRTGAGPTLTHTYGFPGSEQDLLRRGLIGAGFLDPFKARILLQLLLMAGAGKAEITATFSTAGQ